MANENIIGVSIDQLDPVSSAPANSYVIVRINGVDKKILKADFSSDTQAGSSIPDWDQDTIFNTTDNKYAVYDLKIWKSKIDGNQGNTPAEDANWTEVSRSEASAIKEWSQGIFQQQDVVVKRLGKLLELVNPNRPYESIDIDAELAAGDWKYITLIPAGGTTGQVLKKNSNADHDYSWQNEAGGGSGGPAIAGRYATWALLLADQASQEDGFIYYATDASGFSSVDSGYAYFEYLGTTNGDESDYRKVQEGEGLDLDLSGKADKDDTIPADAILKKKTGGGYEGAGFGLANRNKGANTGVIDLSNPFGVWYNNYDLSVSGAITLSVAASPFTFGQAYFRIVADGTTAVNINASFDELYSISDGEVLDAGTYVFYAWKTPTGAALSVPANASTAVGGNAPTVTSIVIPSSDLTEVRINFSENVNASSLAGFTLAGTTETTMTYVSGSGTNQLIGSLATAATALETITSNYNSASGNVVAADDSTPLESFVDESVSVADTIAPSLVSIAIGDIADNVVNFVFDETFANVVPQTSDVVVKFDDVTQSISQVQVISNTMRVTVGASATPDTVVKAAYTQSTGNELQDAAGNLVSNITEQVISNLLDYGAILLDADEANLTIDVSDGVDDWADTSGNNNNATNDNNHNSVAAPAEKPLLLRSNVNGNDVVSIGASARMSIAKNNWISNSKGLTILCAIKPNSIVADSVIISDFNSGTHTQSLYNGDVFTFSRGFRLFNDGFLVGELISEPSGKKTSFSVSQGVWQIIACRWVPTLELASWVNSTKTTATPSRGSAEKAPEASPTIINGKITGAAWQNNIPFVLRRFNIFSEALGDDALASKITELAVQLGITVDVSAFSESAPVFQTAVVGRQSNKTIRLYYNAILNSKTAPAVGDFTPSGTTSVIQSVEIGSYYVDLILDAEVSHSDTITISYTPGTNPIQSHNGNNNASSLSSESVNNYVFDESASVVSIDSRRTDLVTLAATAYQEDMVSSISDKATANSYNRHSGLGRLRTSLDGIISLNTKDMGPAPSLIVDSNNNITNTYSNTNGMTIYVVLTPTTASSNLGILSMWVLSTKFWRLHNNGFHVRDNDTTDRIASFSTLQSSTKYVIACRWVPGVSQEVWINGSVNSAATPATNIVTSNNIPLSIGCAEGWNHSGVISMMLEYVQIIPDNHTNQQIKDNIDKLASGFVVDNVDTSGIPV